jgi:hypothetical protein
MKTGDALGTAKHGCDLLALFVVGSLCGRVVLLLLGFGG